MSETALDKRTIISELTKSPHGKLDAYLGVGRRASLEDPDFFAHLIAYNHAKGQVRDSQVALPVIALQRLATDTESPAARYVENALAHLADLKPREFARALEFGRDIHAPTRMLKRLVKRYLIDLERNKHEWNRTVLQHRATIRGLYAKYDVRPGAGAEGETRAQTYENAVLFGQGPLPYGPFWALKHLSTLGAEDIATTIEKYRIPFLIARGALGAKGKDPDVVLALMKRMTSNDLVTNMAWLEKRGVKTNPVLRSALEQALGKAAEAPKGKRGGTLKTTRAAEALAGDEQLSGKLRVLQEKQIDKLGGIEGNWVVLGDRSGSMKASIEVAKEVAAVLARMVKGNVYLVFFDTVPEFYDVTGKSLEDIKRVTRGVADRGGTSFACGLQAIADKRLVVDGIALVSDGGENSPAGGFAHVYQRYAKQVDHEPTVFWYRVLGDYQAYPGYSRTLQAEANAFRRSCESVHVDVQEYDLTGGVDYYSLPNLVQTMRVSRYALLDDIMATPLRTLDDVLDRTKDIAVLPQRQPVTV